MTEINSAELEARYAKAAKVADAITEATKEFTAREILRLSEVASFEARSMAALIAGTTKPSEETWRMACLMVVQRRAIVPQLATEFERCFERVVAS